MKRFDENREKWKDFHVKKPENGEILGIWCTFDAEDAVKYSRLTVTFNRIADGISPEGDSRETNHQLVSCIFNFIFNSLYGPRVFRERRVLGKSLC